MPNDMYPTEADFNALSQQVASFGVICDNLIMGCGQTLTDLETADDQSKGQTKLAAAQMKAACDRLSEACATVVAAIPEEAPPTT